MTGGELAAGAKALEVASNASKRALSEDEAVKLKLLEMAEDSPAMREAAEAYARRVHIKQGVLTKIYEPLAKLVGIRKEYFGGQFADDLAAKTVGIPDDAVQSPAPSVALPAMQGLGWSLDEPDLKEMYLNLLATATDGRQPDAAHPSFADIIKQLSSAEAQPLLLCLGAPGRSSAIVQVRTAASNDPPSVHRVVINNLFSTPGEVVRNRLRDASEGVWVQNWQRLGLVQITYSSRLNDEEKYEWVEERPEVKELRGYCEQEQLEIEAEVAAHADDPEYVQTRFPRSVDVNRGILRVTDFGIRFLDAVTPLTDPAAVPDLSAPASAGDADLPGA